MLASMGFDTSKMPETYDPDATAAYYEFGADCGNFSASASDYVLVNRISTVKSLMTYASATDTEVTSSILLTDKNGKLIRKDPIHGNSEYKGIQASSQWAGVPVFAAAADTDVDGLVVEYTGEHNIQYQDPAVLAVLASPPYFRDVAAYDENDILVYLTTEYGSSSGVAQGHETSFSTTVGGFFNNQIGTNSFHGVVNLSAGYAREETWGWEKEAICVVCGEKKHEIVPIEAAAEIRFSKKNLTYSGQNIVPDFKVYANDVLVPAEFYRAELPAASKNVGEYAVRVTLGGNYAGTGSAKFTIVPKGTSLSRLTPAKKAITIKWKKQSTQTTGYQIQYSLKKNFSGAKTVTITNKGMISRKITKLKAKKKYFVRIRTFKKVGTKRIASAWSPMKTAKTK